MNQHPHSFHIPVMGTGFTIDTPLRVAHYGITSVISLVDDLLIEQVRRHHCAQYNEPYEPVSSQGIDSRALRITAYLNMVDRLVKMQVAKLKASAFEPESEITRYFDLLPESTLKQSYRQMLETADPTARNRMQEALRQQITPGGIDVNIMTKLDPDRYEDGAKLPPEYADALAALRGFAQSTLHSAIVFSAGINQRLYTYAAKFEDFFPDATGYCKKRIIVKVSDYRSALIQGKFLAKRGLWVSEFRVESGLNCGGHAFAAECNLMGPVLEQFKADRDLLQASLHTIYTKALVNLGRPAPLKPMAIRVTAQGGIGTAYEDRFLMHYYHLDGTGWGTPFMLVPEVTNVDPAHLKKLCDARSEDIFLSNASPLNVPFWNLRSSGSEEMRLKRIEMGKPGSPCPKKYIQLNNEFGEPPICTASRSYIQRKLAQLTRSNQPDRQIAAIRERVLQKACICHDLGGSVSINYGSDAKAAPAVCCGPNIRHFNRISSLEEMVHHIYGRFSLMMNAERSHMFIEEMRLNLDYLRQEIKDFSLMISDRPQSFFGAFKKSLLEGIDYYRDLTQQFIEEQRGKFLEDLTKLQEEIERTCLPQNSAVECRPLQAECGLGA
jgi:hypothetical protein